jgi:hypothetical protein
MTGQPQNAAWTAGPRFPDDDGDNRRSVPANITPEGEPEGDGRRRPRPEGDPDSDPGDPPLPPGGDD